MKPSSLFQSSIAQLFPASNGENLRWRHDLGFGYLPSTGFSYESNYWDNYQRLKDTPMGKRLNDFRISFVRSALGICTNDFKLCDVGIGNGHFVETYPCYGFDINEQAVAWLRDRDRFMDPYVQVPDALTFWDAIEHIDDPSPLLELNIKPLFISLPICRTPKDWLQSKHFKPNEHIWYFTEGGIQNFMAFYGYTLKAKSDGETQIGREDIMTYYFHK